MDFNMVEAGGVERYAPTDNTQLIEKVRTQEPHNPLYARLLCTKSCTTNRDGFVHHGYIFIFLIVLAEALGIPVPAALAT